MGSLFGELLDSYFRQAWVFSALHLLFLLYFIYRWQQNWRQVGELLQALRDDSRESDLLKYARDQISRYAGQGREPDLPRIERYIAGRFDRGPDTIRPLVNAFVIIGLMGTLFSLFALGHQSQELREPKQILGRMGIAFGTSFFGVIWAMVCSVLLLTPLRRRTNSAIQEVGRRLTELSAEYEPRAPGRGLEELALTLRENAAAFAGAVERMSEREETHLNATRAIISEFSDATRSMLESLSAEVEATQARTEQTTATLKGAVTDSLDSLKERFVEISQTWREELKQTIESNEAAAVRLSASSQHLTIATKDVADSLRDVHKSLARTEDLGRIAADVERLTQDYLSQTGKQFEAFRKGLEIISDSARTIPDEWFTMLKLSGDRLEGKWSEITDGWRAHVSDTGDLLTTRLGLINDNLAPVSRLLAHDGELAVTLNAFRSAVVEVKDLLAERDLAETCAPAREESPESGGAQGAGELEASNGLAELTAKVEDIHTLLGDFLGRFAGPAEAAAVLDRPTQPAPSAAPAGGAEAAPAREADMPAEALPAEAPPAETQLLEPAAAKAQPAEPPSAESHTARPALAEQLPDDALPLAEALTSESPEVGYAGRVDDPAPEEFGASAAAVGERDARIEGTVPEVANRHGENAEGATPEEPEPEHMDAAGAEPEVPSSEDTGQVAVGREGSGEDEPKKRGRWWRSLLRFWKRRRADSDAEVTQ